jgi:hypothetical protein
MEILSLMIRFVDAMEGKGKVQEGNIYTVGG